MKRNLTPDLRARIVEAVKRRWTAQGKANKLPPVGTQAKFQESAPEN
jgi:hypothetical protein